MSSSYFELFIDGRVAAKFIDATALAYSSYQHVVEEGYSECIELHERDNSECNAHIVMYLNESEEQCEISSGLPFDYDILHYQWRLRYPLRKEEQAVDTDTDILTIEEERDTLASENYK